MIRQGLLWAGLVGIFVLILLSIYGAFLGAERARMFFNSEPVTIAFFVLGILFFVGLIFILIRRRDVSLALLHLGPLFILLGGWLASPSGLSIVETYTQTERIDKGTILLKEGQKADSVMDLTEGVWEKLGFTLSLEETGIEYYPNSKAVREYYSEVRILPGSAKGSEADAAKPFADRIEVNHPLHFGGYHIYQYGYGQSPEEYTILMVVADNGVGLVYTGYLLICAGVLWRCWLVRVTSSGRGETAHGS